MDCMKSWLAVLLVVILIVRTQGQDCCHYDHFFDFGDLPDQFPSSDDVDPSDVNSNDASTEEITDFVFYGTLTDRVHISSNGQVTFRMFPYDPASATNPPDPAFPDGNLPPMAAAFYTDIDPTLTGDVLYRKINNRPIDLTEADQEIGTLFSGFSTYWIKVVTYCGVTFHNATTPYPTNTFQVALVLGTNGSSTETHHYIIFKYGLLEWDQSQIGFPTVGFNKGDGNASYLLPGSGTADVLNLPYRSNVGIRGTYVYRLDADPIAEEGTITWELACDSQPCENGGNCSENLCDGGFDCACVTGYTGEQCETDIDDCAAEPCLNGGTCIDGIDSYTCNCSDGFTGIHCETNIDDCHPDPCDPHGNCTDGVDDFTCTCEAGYTGDTCQTNIDDCDQEPCQNDATCHDGINTYTCECPPDYTGPNCETKIDNCDQEPCQNGGTCHDGINTYTCECPPDYTGPNCETNIIMCPPGSYLDEGVCTPCPPGFFSNVENADECTPCPPGTFADSPGSTSCTPCPGGQIPVSPTSDACQDCSLDTYSNSGDDECTDCPDDYPITLATGSTQDECLPCITGCWTGNAPLTGKFPACKSCRHYFYCYHGYGHLKRCPAWKKFDPETRTCRWSWWWNKVHCPDTTGLQCPRKCKKYMSCTEPDDHCTCNPPYKEINGKCTLCVNGCPEYSYCDEETGQCKCNYGWRWHPWSGNFWGGYCKYHVLIVVWTCRFTLEVNGWCDDPEQLTICSKWMWNACGGWYQAAVVKCRYGSTILDFEIQSDREVTDEDRAQLAANITNLVSSNGTVLIDEINVPVIGNPILIDPTNNNREIPLVDGCSAFGRFCQNGECRVDESGQPYCECTGNWMGTLCNEYLVDSGSGDETILIVSVSIVALLCLLLLAAVIAYVLRRNRMPPRGMNPYGDRSPMDKKPAVVPTYMPSYPANRSAFTYDYSWRPVSTGSLPSAEGGRPRPPSRPNIHGRMQEHIPGYGYSPGYPHAR